MAKRKSKRALCTLTSIVSIGATGLLTVLGAKSIINNLSLQKSQEFFANINRFSEENFDQISDYNVATKDMFIDTTNLTSFHFGNVQKGQAVTPYGWLGLFDNPDNPSVCHKIALTGWNGEVLWVNNDYENNTTSKWANVYDLKYDWNSNTVFAIRTPHENGLAGSVNENPEIKIDFLDALTGKKKRTVTISGKNSINKTIQWRFADIFGADKWRGLNNYSLDITSLDNGRLALTYMPNFMQFYDKANMSGDPTRSLPSLQLLLENWWALTKTLVFSFDGDGNITNERVINIRPNLSKGWLFNGKQLNKRDFNLLVNPFFTFSNSGDLIFHLFFSNKQANQIFHKIIGFNSWNGNLLGSNLDRIEQINFLSLKPNEWANARNWSKDFINANLRINKNMFDQNSMVFAYPYAASQNNNLKNNFPLFNVAQILINSGTGLVQRNNNNSSKRTLNYDLGKQIYDFSKSSSANTKIKAWPTEPGFTNLNHNYNRLMAVSPFDNTFIYAANKNFTEANLTGSDNSRDDWASFWIGVPNVSNTRYFPLMIGNKNDLGGNIDASLTDVNSLYSDNFTFDLKSLFNDGTGVSLNLYFNQKGTGKSSSYQNPEIKTSKIGLLNDILRIKNNKGWNANVTNGLQGSEFRVNIDTNSFSTLISSKANLEQWYPRTWQNLNNPSNLYLGNAQINGTPSNQTKAVATQFNQTLTDQIFQQKDAVDLYSNWEVGSGKWTNNGSTSSNFNRLVYKGADTNVAAVSEPNKLPLISTYSLDSKIVNKQVWMPTTKKEKLTFKKKINLNNPSYQIFTSWSDQVRMQSVGATTATANFNANFDVQSNLKWHDNRQADLPSQTDLFGKLNNALTLNLDGKQVRPLRLMLRIVKPTETNGNKLPEWFLKIPSDLFSYFPLKADATSNETYFEKVLENFINFKATNLNLDQDNSKYPIGLANLKIEASIDLNPVVSKNNKIYKKDNLRFVYVEQTQQQIFYQDLYKGKHLIFDQSALNYSDANQWGFGPNADINDSWTQKPNNKLKTTLDFSLLKDNLVRKENNNENLFEFKYKDLTRNTIVVQPTDWTWFKNHFSFFNQLFNLSAKFEYLELNSQTWKTLPNLTFNDQQFQQMLSSNNNSFEISNLPANIEKLRIKLVPTNDDNTFIDYLNFDGNADKLISNEAVISEQLIDVDKQWFLDEPLVQNEKLINDLNENDFIDYQKRVLSHSKVLTLVNELKSKVEIVYFFNGETAPLTIKELINKINAYQKDYNNSTFGFLQLWNSTSNQGIKIEAKYQVSGLNVENISFVDSQGDKLDEANLKNSVNTNNVKTAIDLNLLIKWLEKSFIKVQKNSSNPENIDAINFDDYSGEDLHFNQKSWDRIENVLENLGIKIQYRNYLTKPNNLNWSDQKTAVNKYNPNIGQFQIRFVLDPSKATNLKVSIKNSKVLELNKQTESEPIDLNLDVQLKVLLNPTLIQDFIKDPNTVSGNTKFLTINKNNVKTLLTKIIQENIANNPLFSELQNSFNILFAIGDSDNWLDEAQFVEHLAHQKNDQLTNEIKFKFTFDQANSRFDLDQSKQVLSAAAIGQKDAKIKIYINEKGLENLASQIKAIGTNEQIIYQWPGGFDVDENTGQINNIPGLRIQYTTKVNQKNQDYNSSNDYLDPTKGWSNSPVKKIAINKLFIGVQLVATDGYIYAPQYKGPQNENFDWSVHPVDLTPMSLMINLDSEWLKLIKISGNTREIRIEEQQLLNLIKTSNVLPLDQPNLVDLEYSIDNQTWLNKEGFEQFLFTQNGQKDKNHFIIKREDIRVRYKLNTNDHHKHQLVINKTLINENNRDDFNYQLVKSSVNSGFKGYINVDHLKDFNVDNFAITGSIDKPIFEINQRLELESLLRVYASDNLFEILFSTEKAENDEWIFKPENKLLANNGGFIGPDDLIARKIKLKNEKWFAIKIQVKSNDYQIFHLNQLQSQGYILDITKNVDATNHVFNPKKIIYQFDSSPFSVDQIKFETVGVNNSFSQALSGFAKITNSLGLIRYEGNKETIISDPNPMRALIKIEQTIKKDFGDQLRFKIKYIKADGQEEIINNGNINQFQNLKNGEELILYLVPREEELTFPLGPIPLSIKINGLISEAPDHKILNFLRVKQTGTVNGYGGFELLINDPNNSSTDLLDANKWKFVIRVWNKKHRIKHNWTSDQSKLTNLENGDRIEWKLIDATGNMVRDAYYNTIAQPDGSFAQVYYDQGNTSNPKIISLGIGHYPDKDAYPTSGGFVISGLKPAFNFFNINKTGLENFINNLELQYTGLDGNGAITFLNREAFDGKHLVDLNGNLINTNEISNFAKSPSLNQIEVNQFFEGITFYVQNPNETTANRGFKYSQDKINPNNNLKNGSQVWAKIDNKANFLNNEEIIVKLPEVTNLDSANSKNQIIWTTLSVAGAVITLGISWMVALLIRRKHKKLSN